MCALPVRIFDSQPEMNVPERPKAVYNGWQDLVHLASLSRKDKEEINRLQRQYGFDVSGWDQ